jgi:hypothetical protein
VPNSFEENVCENANTLAHVVDHIVVLAHLRCLGFSLSRQACEAGFRRFRGLGMTNILYAKVWKKLRSRASVSHRETRDRRARRQRQTLGRASIA